MPSRELSVVLAIAGVALLLVGIGIGAPVPAEIEGAYFTRAVGTPAYEGVFEATGLRLFDADDGNLWIGAGLALLVVGASSLLAGLARRHA